MTEANEVVILEVAGEGGVITLMGRQNAGDSAWELAHQTIDSSMSMLDEGDSAPNPADGPPPAVWVSTWREAMSLMDRYPWVLLVPLTDHPAFKDEILVEVTHRLVNDPSPMAKRRVQQWYSKCQ